MKKTAVHGIVTANKPWTWIIFFMKAVKHWKPSWESSYGAVYKEKIEAGTLSFKKVTSDFEKELDKIKEKGRGRVVKGSFGPTVEIWCQTLYLFHRLGELTLIVPCYFGHSSVNLRYKIAL